MGRSLWIALATGLAVIGLALAARAALRPAGPAQEPVGPAVVASLAPSPTASPSPRADRDDDEVPGAEPVRADRDDDDDDDEPGDDRPDDDGDDD